MTIMLLCYYVSVLILLINNIIVHLRIVYKGCLNQLKHCECVNTCLCIFSRINVESFTVNEIFQELKLLKFKFVCVLNVLIT